MQILLHKFYHANSVMQILSCKFIVLVLLCKFYHLSIDISLVCQTKNRSQIFCSTVDGALTGSHNPIKSKFNIKAFFTL